MNKLVTLSALVAMFCVGCESPSAPKVAVDAFGQSLDRDIIISQLCIPDERIHLEDIEIALDGIPQVRTMREALIANGHPEPPQEHVPDPVTSPQQSEERAVVRRWLSSEAGRSTPSSFSIGEALKRDGVLSTGSAPAKLWSDSSAHQPILELEGHGLKETLAISASRVEKGQFITYWYIPPRQLKAGEFSAWQPPVTLESMEDQSGPLWKESAFERLARGEQVRGRPVPINAPKIRFRLSTVEEYYDQIRFWTRAHEAAVRQFVRGQPRSDGVLFAPKLKDSIPSC